MNDETLGNRRRRRQRFDVVPGRRRSIKIHDPRRNIFHLLAAVRPAVKDQIKRYGTRKHRNRVFGKEGMTRRLSHDGQKRIPGRIRNRRNGDRFLFHPAMHAAHQHRQTDAPHHQGKKREQPQLLYEYRVRSIQYPHPRLQLKVMRKRQKDAEQLSARRHCVERERKPGEGKGRRHQANAGGHRNHPRGGQRRCKKRQRRHRQHEKRRAQKPDGKTPRDAPTGRTGKPRDPNAARQKPYGNPRRQFSRDRRRRRPACSRQPCGHPAFAPFAHETCDKPQQSPQRHHTRYQRRQKVSREIKGRIPQKIHFGHGKPQPSGVFRKRSAPACQLHRRFRHFEVHQRRLEIHFQNRPHGVVELINLQHHRGTGTAPAIRFKIFRNRDDPVHRCRFQRPLRRGNVCKRHETHRGKRRQRLNHFARRRRTIRIGVPHGDLRHEAAAERCRQHQAPNERRRNGGEPLFGMRENPRDFKPRGRSCF